MNLGNNLYESRKKTGLSQEEVAEKLGVSRKTISKWETKETIPDIYQAKQLSKLYSLTLDELINFDKDLQEIEQVIKNTNEEKESKIDWTKTLGKKYPILLEYQNKINIEEYAQKIREMLIKLQKEENFNNLDSMLILKDILYHEWKDKK